MRRILAASAVTWIAVALAGCALFPDSDRLEARDADDTFELVLRVGSTRYPANQPIDAVATLSYLGPDAGMGLVGSGSGLIQFSAKQLDGRLDIAGAGHLDCKPYRIDKGGPLVVPYEKSGGWSADNPDAAFYEAFFKDPIFRLPRGTWRISAAAGFYEEECAGVQHRLGAELTIFVD